MNMTFFAVKFEFMNFVEFTNLTEFFNFSTVKFEFTNLTEFSKFFVREFEFTNLIQFFAWKFKFSNMNMTEFIIFCGEICIYKFDTFNFFQCNLNS